MLTSIELDKRGTYNYDTNRYDYKWVVTSTYHDENNVEESITSEFESRIIARMMFKAMWRYMGKPMLRFIKHGIFSDKYISIEAYRNVQWETFQWTFKGMLQWVKVGHLSLRLRRDWLLDVRLDDPESIAEAKYLIEKHKGFVHGAEQDFMQDSFEWSSSNGELYIYDFENEGRWNITFRDNYDENELGYPDFQAGDITWDFMNHVFTSLLEDLLEGKVVTFRPYYMGETDTDQQRYI